MHLHQAKPSGRSRDVVWLEFVCDRCLNAGYSTDTDPIPRCPRCAIRMTPDDLSIPFDTPARARETPTPRASPDDPDVLDRMRDLIADGLSDAEILETIGAEFDFGDDP